MQQLGESWDVVEVVRALVTEVTALQKIVAGLEARVQVLTEVKVPNVLRPGSGCISVEAEAKPKRAVAPGQSPGASGAEGLSPGASGTGG